MAEVAAASLALGILPLIFSAVQNYKIITQPLITFTRNSGNEARRLNTCLIVCTTRYINHCERLLHNVTVNQGSSMIDNTTHLLWQDPQTEDRLKKRLGNSYDACKTAIESINELLKSLSEIKGLMILNEKYKSGRLNLESFQRLKQRYKISVSKNVFRRHLHDLDDQIDHFQDLCDSLWHLDRLTKSTSNANIENESACRSRALYSGAVQRASLDLFEAIENVWQCSITEAHMASLRLKRATVETGHLKFNLVWICPRRERTPDFLGKSKELYVEASSELKVPKGMPLQQLILKQKLCETLNINDDPSSSSSQELEVAATPDINSVPLIPLDLHCTPNLCQYLEERKQNGKVIRCAGIFRETSDYEHKIYISHNRSVQASRITTLEDYLKIEKTKVGPFPNLELASLLAQAVPQHHSTACLMNAWSSRDVVFFDAPETLDSPYLRSNLGTQSTWKDQCMVSPLQNGDSEWPKRRKYIPDQTLRALGFILIQLALNKHIDDLEASRGDEDKLNAAKRLTYQIEREVGPNYAEIVRTCLDGGFGTAEEFFKEVVLKLEHCGRKCVEALQEL